MVDSKEVKVPVNRDPLTKEMMAVSLANGDFKTHPAGHLFGEALYLSIEKMLFRLAYKYKPTCELSLDDLVNDCYLRILEKLNTFDPSRGKFTTWTWRVSVSVLTRRYYETKKHRSNRADVEAAESSPVNEDPYLRTDIVQALEELFYRWPEHFEVFRAMFGGSPYGIVNLESREASHGFTLPDSVDIRRVSQHSGVKSREVRKVLNDVVRPFFVEWFGEPAK